METKKIVRMLLLISVTSFVLTMTPVVGDLPKELDKVYDSQLEASFGSNSIYTILAFLLSIVVGYIGSLIQTWRLKNSGIYMMALFYLSFFFLDFKGVDCSTNTVWLLETISDITYASAATIVYLKNKGLKL